MVNGVEGLEALPGCPVGGECTGGQTLEDGILGVEVKVVEGCRHGKVVQENGGTGVGRGSASGAKRLNFCRERRESRQLCCGDRDVSGSDYELMCD